MAKREIMVRAHELARTMEGDYRARMSLALRQAWSEAKANRTFTIRFEAEGDKRKGIPYVARITGLDPQYGLRREFVKLPRFFDRRNGVTVSGSFQVRVGEILEIRRGASWKNDYRSFYRVDEHGELVEIGGCDSRSKAEVAKLVREQVA